MARPPQGTTLLDRFDEAFRVDVATGCWLWLKPRKVGRRNLAYGSIKIGAKAFPAHRVSYELFRGPIPRGKQVLHSCDTSHCVNPAHLFTGTQLDNVRDCVAKDRLCRGERQPAAKLSDAKVRQIKRTYKPWDRTRSMRVLSARFKVAVSVISDVLNGNRWSHVP